MGTMRPGVCTIDSRPQDGPFRPFAAVWASMSGVLKLQLTERVPSGSLLTKLSEIVSKKGRYRSYHVLNRCGLPGLELDFMLVDLSRIHTLSLPAVRAFAELHSPRVRLRSPYREHLAQAFARFFMRVGLPVDIPDFK